MMLPFVVDANVMNYFQDERISGVAGAATDAINTIVESFYIAIDDNGPCMNEWIACAAGADPFALQTWIDDMLVAQKIRFFQVCKHPMHKELTGLGIPKKDHKWVRMAHGSKSPVILTEDIDLIEPKKKGCSSKESCKIKYGTSGSCRKYLRKKHGIDVICCPHVPLYAGQLHNEMQTH